MPSAKNTRVKPVKPPLPPRKRVDKEKRRLRLLNAGRTLFLKNGYANTSLNAVIRIAGGSKASIQQQFTNKAGLFAAVIESTAASFAVRLQPCATASPRLTLQHFGEEVLRFYLLPEALQIYRGVIATAVNFPPMAQAFYLRGHEQVVAPIAEQLRLWHQGGKIEAVDFHAEADRFTHMLRNGLYEQRLLGLQRRSHPDDITAQVRGAVDRFLNGLLR